MLNTGKHLEQYLPSLENLHRTDTSYVHDCIISGLIELHKFTALEFPSLKKIAILTPVKKSFREEQFSETS